MVNSGLLIRNSKLKESLWPTIAIHIVIWVFVLLFPLLFLKVPQQSVDNHLVIFGVLMLLFYTNLFFLIPRFLLRGRVTLFLSGLVLLFLVSYVLIISYYNYFDQSTGNPDIYMRDNYNWARDFIVNTRNKPSVTAEDLLNEMNRLKGRRLISRPFRIIFILILVLVVSSAIRITQEWLRNEKLHKESENERLNAELHFLKSQVNPHFLFNTLNSLYSLAYKQSDKTPGSIAKLSNILRYMLYETDRKTVPLENEINYLSDYIDLQKLRLYDNIEIHFDTRGNYTTAQIAPLLLVPFVENAFKHGVDNTSDCFISINLEVIQNDLVFTVENSVPSGKAGNNEVASGIGLQNVKRRLKLLYPDNHLLLIDAEPNVYRIKLNLRLTGYELHNS